MAQFASTLYPQTNPTNPILLALRSIYVEYHVPFHIKLSDLAADWLDLLDRDPAMLDSSNWGDLTNVASFAQIDHARRVLTRMASLSG